MGYFEKYFHISVKLDKGIVLKSNVLISWATNQMLNHIEVVLMQISGITIED